MYHKKGGVHMEEQLLFDQMKLIRKMTLHEFKHVTEEQADVIPEGFRNNIRWNLGHIYVVQHALLHHYGGIELEMDKRFQQYFSPNTSPDDWEGTPPSLNEIKEKLEKQVEEIEVALKGKLGDTAKEPFLRQNNVGQIFSFTFYHEGLHVTAVKDYKRILSVQ